MNYAWEKSYIKTVRTKFSMDSSFLNMLYGKIRKPGNNGNQ